MVQSPDDTDIQPRRPLTLDVSSRSMQHSQYANQQVPVSMPQSYGQQHPIKSLQPGPLRLDNLVINGGSGYGPGGPPSDSSHNNGPHPMQNYQDGGASAGAYPSSPQGSMGTYHSGSGSQRLDSLLLGQSTPTSTTGAAGGMPQGAPPPPERGSSFVVMSQQQQQTHSSTGMGVLRNTISTSSANQSSTNALSNSPGMSSTTTTTTTKRVSFHDSKVVTFDDNANHQERSTVREDPNNFINEAQTLLATPRSPDGSFTGNTPGVIGAQEVYRDPRTRRLAEQQKLMGNRTGPLPEKLSFKEKMKMFAMETGEDGTPKDKVKISRAQRDIEGPPNGYGLN
ncbi:hypothetical protein J437_LFUL018261 [Ladona fulva]|uniref:Uncharacterized protein n=1 Tax=Ladona fulva TaxID=123851 RepID=A0A8K0KN87_LADFU|nr:hypothetical protein J437_LFUL018261 [Ladona fulva]